ncbi:MAG: hypothetical protein ACLPYS_19545, partial [Vulcanimicrobiaceae bacterium]
MSAVDDLLKGSGGGSAVSGLVKGTGARSAVSGLAGPTLAPEGVPAASFQDVRGVLNYARKNPIDAATGVLLALPNFALGAVNKYLENDTGDRPASHDFTDIPGALAAGANLVAHPGQVTQTTHELQSNLGIPPVSSLVPGARVGRYGAGSPGGSSPLARLPSDIGQAAVDLALQTAVMPFSPELKLLGGGAQILGRGARMIPGGAKALDAVGRTAAKVADPVLHAVVPGHDLRKAMTQAGEDIVRGVQGAAKPVRHRLEDQYAALVERNRAELQAGTIPPEIENALRQRAYREGDQSVRREALRAGYVPTAEDRALNGGKPLNLLHKYREIYEPTQKVMDAKALAETAGPITIVRQGNRKAGFDLPQSGARPEDPLDVRILDRLVRGARLESYHATRRDILERTGLTPQKPVQPLLDAIERASNEVGPAGRPETRLRRLNAILLARNEAAKGAEARRAATLTPGVETVERPLEFLSPRIAQEQAARQVRRTGLPGFLETGEARGGATSTAGDLLGFLRQFERGKPDIKANLGKAQLLPRIISRERRAAASAGAEVPKVARAAGELASGERAGAVKALLPVISGAQKLGKKAEANVARASVAGAEARANSESAVLFEQDAKELERVAQGPAKSLVLQEARHMAVPDLAGYDSVARVLGRKPIEPDWVWKSGAWRIADEFTDVPKRWLDLTKKPKHLPQDVGGIISRAPGNLDDVASSVHMTDEELRAWLLEHRRPPRIVDYLADANGRLSRQVARRRDELMQRLGGHETPAEAIAAARKDVAEMRAEAEKLVTERAKRKFAERELGKGARGVAQATQKALPRAAAPSRSLRGVLAPAERTAKLTGRVHEATRQTGADVMARLQKALKQREAFEATRAQQAELLESGNTAQIPKKLDDELFGTKLGFTPSLAAKFADAQRDVLFLFPGGHAKNVTIAASLGPNGGRVVVDGMGYAARLARGDAALESRVRGLESIGASVSYTYRESNSWFSKIP